MMVQDDRGATVQGRSLSPANAVSGCDTRVIA